MVQLNGKLSKAGKSYLLTLNDPLRLTLNNKLVYVYTLLLNFGEYEEYKAYKPEEIDPTELVGSNMGFAGTITLNDAGNEAWAEAVDKDRDFASEKLVGHTLAVMQVIEVE